MLKKIALGSLALATLSLSGLSAAHNGVAIYPAAHCEHLNASAGKLTNNNGLLMTVQSTSAQIICPIDQEAGSNLAINVYARDANPTANVTCYAVKHAPSTLGWSASPTFSTSGASASLQVITRAFSIGVHEQASLICNIPGMTADATQIAGVRGYELGYSPLI